MRKTTIFSVVLLCGLCLTVFGQELNERGFEATRTIVDNNGNSPASDLTDYFRTKQSGIWHDVTTWESSPDSVNWTDATLTPNLFSNYIIIREGHTISVWQSVDVNQTVIEPNAVLYVNGTGSSPKVVFSVSDGPQEKDLTVYGRIVATGVPDTASPYSVNSYGVISFEDGSVYEHYQNGGGIPISTWQEGSTLLLNGISSVVPANKAQNYSNIVVDLPNLTFNLNMGFQDNIISGDITIINTGSYRWVLVGPVPNETRTVTIMGDIIQYAGNFNSHGTENPNSTAILHTYGNINVMGGNFSVVRGAQGGSGTTTWYLHGDLSISNATTQNGNPTGGKFVFTGEGQKNLVLDNVTFGPGGLPIEVDAAKFNIGNSVIRGDGIFTLGPGSELLCANPGGLDGALQTTGAVTLSSDAEYTFYGQTPQVTGTRLPAEIKNLTLQNPTDITLSSDVTVTNEIKIDTGYFFLNGKTITLGSSGLLLEYAGLMTGEEGKITTTRDLNAPAGNNIGGIGAEITTSSNLGMTKIERFHSAAVINGMNGIKRQYYIEPQTPPASDVTLRLHYHDSELDTVREESLRIYVSQDGVNWTEIGGLVDTSENVISLAGLTSFSYFTLAYGSGPTAVEDENQIPGTYSLYQNYPNPFNPSTSIKYGLPFDSEVTLEVFNLIGEKIEQIQLSQNAGFHEVNLNFAGKSSGIYFYSVKAVSADGANKFSSVKKMILMK